MPDLPTVAESGLPGYEVEIWYGVLAPAGIPKPIVARLNGEMKRVLELQDVKEKLAGQGADALSSTPEEFAERIKSDMA